MSNMHFKIKEAYASMCQTSLPLLYSYCELFPFRETKLVKKQEKSMNGLGLRRIYSWAGLDRSRD
jgi:hypothetical protein